MAMSPNSPPPPLPDRENTSTGLMETCGNVRSPDDRGQLKLVQLVLACTAHPDREIATIPLYFWYRFCRVSATAVSCMMVLRSNMIILSYDQFNHFLFDYFGRFVLFF